jgi:hypothetical protein
MDMLLSLLVSKVGAILAGALGVLAVWLRMVLLKRRAENAEARARTVVAEVEIQKVEAEYAPKIDRVEEAGRSGDAAAVADLINRVFGNKAKPE